MDWSKCRSAIRVCWGSSGLKTDSGMAHSRNDQKKASREEIVRRASERFRKDGLAAVGVRKLMADAGLTHGAFYAHFPSRTELVSAALDHAVGNTLTYLTKAVNAAPEGTGLQALVYAYLRPEHRDRFEAGCAASALAPEIAREDEKARVQFERSNRAIINLIASQLPDVGSGADRHAWASVVFASMLGTVQLMRITSDQDEIDNIMRAGQKAALILASQWSFQVDDPGSRT